MIYSSPASSSSASSASSASAACRSGLLGGLACRFLGSLLGRFLGRDPVCLGLVGDALGELGGQRLVLHARNDLGDAVGGLGALGNPLVDLGDVEIDDRRITCGVVGADLLDDATIALLALVGDHDAIERGLVGTMTCQTDDYQNFSFNLSPAPIAGVKLRPGAMTGRARTDIVTQRPQTAKGFF